MGTSQQFSLRWNNYLRHITNAFDSLRNEEDLVDVTLSCEGKRIRAHKMLLSACSTYFRDLFKENPCQHPVIIFRNVKFEDLAALIDFMYQGEVNVVQDQLASFLTTAELLAVQGLSEGNGKDAADQPKEVELPDSPILPTEPEVQLSNNQKSGPITSTPAQVASPLSFFPVEQRSESPPSSKRRKWSSGVSAAKTSDKEESERRKTARQSSPDPIEIIPVVPNLKLEMPDYMEQEQDASSCSYSDSNQGGGVQGGSRGESSIPAMSQLLAASDGTGSGGGGGKHEPSEIYSTNSGDSSLPPPTEGLSASDISQILAKPGPSGEQQSQDSLQGCIRNVSGHVCSVCGKSFLHKDSLKQHYNIHLGIPWSVEEIPWAEKFGSPVHYTCSECGRLFTNKGSLHHHVSSHRGHTKCPVCGKVLGRIHTLKLHLRKQHQSWNMNDTSVISD